MRKSETDTCLVKARFIELFKFGLVGAFATLIHVSVIVLLVESFKWKASNAVLPAFCLAFVCSYALNYGWTFRASGSHLLHAPRSLAASFLGLLANWGIMYAATGLLDLGYQIGMITGIVVIPFFTFLLNRKWVFRKK